MAAERRDQAGDDRDQAADERDQAADRRDVVADERDRVAEARDRAAEGAEAGSRVAIPPDVLGRAAMARQHAASDRRRASQDRGAGAEERTGAERDRDTALADRGVAAREREASSFDDLTGAYLRRSGFVELEREIRRARRSELPLVLAFVDVDGLKTINDSDGHAAGDRLLREVADAFRAHLRTHDLIVRYGGDEFVCALSGLDMAGAAKRLALINEALATSSTHGSTTTGLADLRPDDSLEDLLTRADGALYRERQKRSARTGESPAPG
jgi:diguanylate cyclase (GGDEF)-like protein